MRYHGPGDGRAEVEAPYDIARANPALLRAKLRGTFVRGTHAKSLSALPPARAW
ncbi:MAG: hypothetical protein R3F43_28640 [bacterium]